MAEDFKPTEGQPAAPPIQAYAGYPRGAAVPRYGSPEKLQALMDGYYGLNWAFLVFVVLAILSIVTLVASQASTVGIVLFCLLAISALVAEGVIAYRYNKRLGFGLNWNESTALWISIGLVVGSVVISPVIVFIVLQLIALAEIKNYGVKSGFFGVRKKDIKARIAQLRQETLADLSAPPSQV